MITGNTVYHYTRELNYCMYSEFLGTVDIWLFYCCPKKKCLAVNMSKQHIYLITSRSIHFELISTVKINNCSGGYLKLINQSFDVRRAVPATENTYIYLVYSTQEIGFCRCVLLHSDGQRVTKLTIITLRFVFISAILLPGP